MRQIISIALVALCLAACGRAPTPEELASQTSTEAESFWKEAIVTARITNTMKVRDEFFTNIEGLERYPSSDRPTIPDASKTDDFFSDLKVFATRIFTEANVVDRGGSQMVFRVSGVDICT